MPWWQARREQASLDAEAAERAAFLDDQAFTRSTGASA